MIENIFISLTEILSKGWYLALIGAFLWGILSVILSPCHLASIPLIVAFINGQGKINFKKAFWISFLFSSGILLSILGIGLVTGLTGKILGDIGIIGNIIVAIIFFIVGLYFLGILPLPDLINLKQPEQNKKRLFSGFFLGLMYGLSLGPCTFAFLSPILGIVFNSASKGFLFSFMLIFLYAVGHTLVFIFFGVFSGLVQKFLNWDQKAKGTIIIKKVVGIIIILVGVYIVIKNVT